VLGGTAGCDRQCRCEQQEYQGVVMRPADGQLEQHGVQSHEGHRPTRRLTKTAGGSRDERHRAEARSDRDGLEGPQPAGKAKRGGRVACEREQRAIGRVLEGPSEEREDRVTGGFGGDMRVGVKAVQGSHAGEAQVAEDVLGDQWRAQEQDHVRRHDRRHDRPRR
jgi:hypothetical protein